MYLVFLYRTSFLHSASYNILAFDGQEKGFGISTESIGHLTRDLASVLIENGSDVEAWYTTSILQLAGGGGAVAGGLGRGWHVGLLFRMLHDSEPKISTKTKM